MFENRLFILGNSSGNVGLAIMMGTILSTVVLAILSLISAPSVIPLVNAQVDIPIADIDSANEIYNISRDQQDSPLGSDFVWKGMISSDVSILPGREITQSAIILPPRQDGAMYTGTLTFQASKPVDVISWSILDQVNVTVSEDIGNRDNVMSIQGLDLALNELDTSSESGSVVFTGNVLELADDDDPFIVTYSVNARADNASQLNDVHSLFELAGSEEEQED